MICCDCLSAAAVELVLQHVPGVGHPLEPGLVVVLHPPLHVGVDQRLHLALQLVRRDTRPDLHQENDAQQGGECEGHAVVLLNGTAAAEEGDEKDDAADNNKEYWSVEEAIAEKVKILTVRSLHYSACHDQEQTRELQGKG